MDKKKIAGVLGALVCATSFFTADLSTAEASAADRERVAEQNRKTTEQSDIVELIQGTSREARIVTPIVLNLQSRIAQYNNVGITSEIFDRDNEYKDTLHPAVVVDNCYNSYSAGNGHLYFGIESIKKDLESYNLNSMKDFDYISIEKTIAHEAGHSLSGNEYAASLFAKKSESRCEQEAEDVALRLLDNLPEGGWGAYTMSVSRCANRPEQNIKNLKMMEKRVNNRVQLNSNNLKYNGIIDHKAAACDESSYIASNGKSYKIVAGIDAKTERNIYYNVDPTYHNDNAYLAGQIAECIAKDAFKPENLFVAQNNLKSEIEFDGDYLLICKSSTLPNGYRVLASLYGPASDLTHMIDMLRQNQIKPLDGLYNDCIENMEKSGKQSAIRSGWLIAEIGAMAVDNAARAKN